MIFPAAIGFLLGFLGAIPVAGPVSALVLNLGLKKQHSRGLALALGAAMAEALYVLLAFAGFQWMFQVIPNFDVLSRWVASAVMVFLGMYFIFNKDVGGEEIPKVEQSRKRKRGSFIIGFSVSALNPTLMATWTTVITTVNAWRIFDFHLLSAMAFALGVAMGIIVWFGLMLYLIRKNHHRIQGSWVRKILLSIGMILLVMGSLSLQRLVAG